MLENNVGGQLSVNQIFREEMEGLNLNMQAGLKPFYMVKIMLKRLRRMSRPDILILIGRINLTRNKGRIKDKEEKGRKERR